MKLLIADDEAAVRDGLCCILNWKALGFTICGTASTGEEALTKILHQKPELVLMDIRMPMLSGIKVVELARKQQFTGKFIILSGISDFKYAQTAIRYGVDFYLTKPIDEDELQNAVETVHQSIEQMQKHIRDLNQYRTKAKDTILHDLILGTADPKSLDTKDLGLTADAYQLILYENYDQSFDGPCWDFAKSLRVTCQDSQPFEHFQINNKNYLLLKGISTIQYLSAYLTHHSLSRRSSHLSSLFLACSRIVSQLEDLPLTAKDLSCLEERRFFCEPEQHILTTDSLPPTESLQPVTGDQNIQQWEQLFSSYIQMHSREKVIITLKSLQETLYNASDSINQIQYFLTDIYLRVKQSIAQIYPAAQIPFPSNATVLSLIESKRYLYEIIQFFSEQFEVWFNAIGTPSSDDVLDDLLVYIRHNFRQNLRLETLAPLFGYNSSYLGKIFSKKTGCSFNTYVDKIRIQYALEQLKGSNLKIYEIAEQAGYCNVDYFHKKFRKYIGISPAEYRQQSRSAE